MRHLDRLSAEAVAALSAAHVADRRMLSEIYDGLDHYEALRAVSTLVSGFLNLAEMVAKDHAITVEEIIQNLGHHVAVWNEGLVE